MQLNQILNFMKLSKTQKISIRIILLFTIAMLMTFIPENFRDFFGDWKCQGSGKYLKESWVYSGCNYGESGTHEAEFHWGYRHWLFFTMGLTLFVIQVIDIIDKCLKE